MLQDGPTVLGERYRVVERLGRGGMADVYRADDEVLRRSVAVKVFRGGAERDVHLARFRAEVRTLARLTHPRLVALYDAGGDVSAPWCAMEYVNGGSLGDRTDPIDSGVMARIGEQMAAALAYVHDCGIVHRDVKPSNVLLDRDGSAFLSDFGIARMIDGTRMTQSGLMIGTAAFLSPEQVRGEPAGPPSDVYALGLVLLEGLTARREFPGTPVESAVARLNRGPAIPDDLGDTWGELLTAMTAQRAADRPEPDSVRAVLADVVRSLAPPTPTTSATSVTAVDRATDRGRPDASARSFVLLPPLAGVGSASTEDDDVAANGPNVAPPAPGGEESPGGEQRQAGEEPAGEEPVGRSVRALLVPVHWRSRRGGLTVLAGSGLAVALIAMLPHLGGGGTKQIGVDRAAATGSAMPNAADSSQLLLLAPVTEVGTSAAGTGAQSGAQTAQVARRTVGPVFPRGILITAPARSTARSTTTSPTPTPTPTTTTTTPVATSTTTSTSATSPTSSTATTSSTTTWTSSTSTATTGTLTSSAPTSSASSSTG